MWLLLLLSHFSRVWLCATPWTVAHQAPPSMGFSRQEYWSAVPLPSPSHVAIYHKNKQSNQKMGRRFKQTFLQRRHRDGQEAHGKVFNITNYCCSVTQLCPTLCDPMNCSTPGFLVLHHLPELAQTLVHWVGDIIQPSHPLSFRFSPRLQSFPASGSFLTSWLFWISFSTSPSNEYSGLISFRID